MFRSNLLGTQFTLFDHGDNPKKNGTSEARQELIGVAYVSTSRSFFIMYVHMSDDDR